MRTAAALLLLSTILAPIARADDPPAIQPVMPAPDVRRADTRRADVQSPARLVAVMLPVPAAATAMDRLTMVRSMTVAPTPATATTPPTATMDALAMVFPLSAV